MTGYDVTTNATPGGDTEVVSEREGPSTKPTLLCHAVFVALGLLLIVAAGFKTYQVYSQPMQRFDLFGTLALICFEVSFGTWLVVGARTSWTWRAVVACFSMFACFSAFKAMTGATSCGCFGTLEVNPWVSLGIDITALTLLSSCRTCIEAICGNTTIHSGFARVISIALALSLLATAVSLFGHYRFVPGDGSATMAGQLVILEPESWIGKRWPLLADTGLETNLASGEWGVLLYRHDCHVCHDVMIELEQSLLLGNLDTRVALIGIDKRRHDALVDRLQGLGCQAGYLPRDREWFTTTPLRLLLNEGMCVSAEIVESWK